MIILCHARRSMSIFAAPLSLLLLLITFLPYLEFHGSFLGSFCGSFLSSLSVALVCSPGKNLAGVLKFCDITIFGINGLPASKTKIRLISQQCFAISTSHLFSPLIKVCLFYSIDLIILLFGLNESLSLVKCNTICESFFLDLHL